MTRNSVSSNNNGLRGSLTVLAFTGAIGLMRLLGPARSSGIGARIVETIGPFLPASRVAMHNITIAFPDMEKNQQKKIIRGAWNNLGRVVGEFSHLRSMTRTSEGPGWEVSGEENIAAAWKDGLPPLFFSAHLGNWEMILPIAGALGLPVGGVYRAASNPIMERLIQRIRGEAGHGTFMFPKGARGARAIIGHLSAGGTMGLLVDQKMNDGIAVPFFGQDAWTAPALAQLATRFQRNIVPIRVVRIGATRFRLECEPALTLPATGERGADQRLIMEAVNAHVEGWIRQEPQQWLWFHRRWPKAVPIPHSA
ncbi:LpxL/LpxP family acyltransferase [Acetobacter conturbans]|nr:lauroyl acyltransferase [Acetobacter conturbans]